jgi:hypothetical protein
MAIDDTAEIVRRRRAVFAALLMVFPRDDAIAAVAVWDRDYRDGRSPYDGLNVFARHVCSQFAQPGRHRELIQRLMECFFAPESALPADPGSPAKLVRATGASTTAAATVPAAAAAETSVAGAAPVVPAVADPAPARTVTAPPSVATWLRIIQRFVAELAPVDRAAATTLPSAMLQNAVKLGVDPLARELLRLALEGRNNERLQRVTERDLRTLLNHAYVHAATAAGPVAADRALARAIAAVEAMPEGERFAPRRLL